MISPRTLAAVKCLRTEKAWEPLKKAIEEEIMSHARNNRSGMGSVDDREAQMLVGIIRGLTIVHDWMESAKSTGKEEDE